MRLIGMIIIASFFLVSCQSEDTNGWNGRNLLEYGVPLTILAPDSVKITKTDYSVGKEVTIESENSDDYNVQVLVSTANTVNVGTVKERELNLLKGMSIFSKITLDEPNGFIYETVTDSTLFSYGFRRVIIQGDKEYVFQTGIGTYSQEQTMKMYHATEPQEMKK